MRTPGKWASIASTSSATATTQTTKWKPKVGDWVKPVMCDRVFQVSENKEGRTRTGLDWWNTADLEPASPPVEKQEHDCSCDWEHGGFNFSEAHIAKKDPACPVHGAEKPKPKPTLDGPHWDRTKWSADNLTRPYGSEQRCILDLRDAVRWLMEGK